ncbi:MAG TPA: outer membrane beta-barrel protein [Candidatus Methylacidiphilales bacterium]|nr:outer membrane beta-barrel protein [Candidatus Methylacidiphilales bacterium]
MKPVPIYLLRHALVVLVLLSVSPFLLTLVHAQPESAPAATNVTTPATPAVTTNAAPATPTPPADTNAVPAAPATNVTGTATPGSEMEQEEGPPSPGAMAAPTTELIGPPAPGSQNAPALMTPGGEGAMPGNNPAVTDVTNNPGAVAGLGQRKLPFYFGLNLGEMYDDNILISPDDEKKGSFITHVSPSIDYQLGDQTEPHTNYLNLYFSPEIYFYNTQHGFDRIDYNGDIYYQYNWTRLSLGLEQNYQHLTDASLDEGSLVSRNIYTTKGNASYVYNDDLTLFATATQQISAYPGITIKEWDLDTFALYQVAPKLQIGAGPRIAFIDITNAPNEQHQDLLFRLKYVPDSHFVVSFEGGAEYLQYQNNKPDRLLPIFDANIYYNPIPDTTLFLSASKQTYNSFDFSGDTIDFSTVQAGASQLFLQHFTATATGGYHDAEYQEGVNREDNYWFAKGDVQWTPNNWLQVEASYQWSSNNSTFSEFSFTDNQVDLQSTVKF